MLRPRGVVDRLRWSGIARPSAIAASLILISPALTSLGVQVAQSADRAKLTINPPVLDIPDRPLPPVEEGNAPGGDQPLYEVGTHRAITNVAIRRNDCVADAYLKNEMMLQNGILTSTSQGTPAARIEDGAEDEDEQTYTRPFNHFYNPINNSGLSDLVSGTNSLQWAYNAGGNNESWVRARDSFYNSVTKPSKSQRLTELATTFFRLGHPVHLLEDLGQPQHTRNDAHRVGAEYEAYCLAHYGTPGAIQGLPTFGAPSFSGGTSPFGDVPAEFAGFWDTEQYTGQANFTVFGSTPGLAEFSNAYFITDDTMFGNTRLAVLPRTGAGPLRVLLTDSADNRSTAAAHLFPHPHIRNTNLASFYANTTNYVWVQREGTDVPNATHYVDLTVRNGAGQVVFTVPSLFALNNSNEVGFDNTTYEAHAQVLIPRTLGYSVGLINYFFRGKIGLNDPATGWDATEKKNTIEIRNDSNEAFGAGTWELYYDDVNGNRTKQTQFDTSAYSSLSPGASFTAKYPEMLCDGGYAFTLVFKGKIGNEENAIATKSFYPAQETWVGSFYVPSGDPLCYDVTNQVYAIFERPTPAGYDIVAYIQFVGSSDLFGVAGNCTGDQLQLGFSSDCGWLLSGTISGSTLTSAQTCCWYCPLNPPPTGPWFCGTVTGMERTQ